MKQIKSFWEWLVLSSKNPNKIALTLKAGIPFLILFHIGDATTLGTVADAIVNVIVQTVTWVSGILAAYGAIRKLYITFFKKDNE